ncbi:hypothetical protein D910_06604 [Dendroctonus ponderosae]|uniref:THAP-type domain-containing protein n=1 Tax=Dendroctonus ponderosae TaxID=77166 RepID=U4UH53_DENPD|nr:hypothetical protein D910_06604 [Dendroctonus ponderosae]
MRNDRICLRHFITQKPAALEGKINPDVLPNENLGYFSSVQAGQSACLLPIYKVFKKS